MTGVNRPVEDLTGQPAGGPDSPTDVRRDRIVVITGASSGIGLAAALELARRGDEVALVGRDPARLTAAGERVRQVGGRSPALYRADFGVLDDVRRLAGNLRQDYDRIEVLANNAGSIVLTPTTSVDGFELTMQTNYLAPFLLTSLLRDRLGRVVTTGSGAHRGGALDPDDLSAQLRDYRPFRAYGTSKQADILFAAEAARRWPELLSTAYDPGPARTRIGTGNPVVAFGMRWAPFMPSPARGARTLVWLARQDPATLVNGGYYGRERLRVPRPRAADPELAARLWRASERAVGLA
jgi:NAD(P)-dependent dehydrogenase (short-subunit alcohol dehydrogenase family)